MKPIIDPSVFYWMNVLSILQTVLAVIGVISFVAGIILTACCVYEWYDEPLVKPTLPDKYDEFDKKTYDRHCKEYALEFSQRKKLKRGACILLALGLIFVGLSVFIPGKTTSVEMLVAKTATYDNVNWSIEQVKEVIDYIVSSLKGLS